MFNFLFAQERYELQKKSDDLLRALQFEQRERASDAERIRLQEALEAVNTRLDYIEAKYKAEAEATKSAFAEEYAKKAVEIAAKAAADYGAAMGTSVEKILECLKEFKPLAASVSVLPTATPVIKLTSQNPELLS